MEQITLYTKDNCPECVKVKTALINQGYEFNEVPIDHTNIDMLREYTRSAPAVFIGESFTPNSTFLT
jgi:glutaredoxin